MAMEDLYTPKYKDYGDKNLGEFWATWKETCRKRGDLLGMPSMTRQLVKQLQSSTILKDKFSDKRMSQTGITIRSLKLFTSDWRIISLTNVRTSSWRITKIRWLRVQKARVTKVVVVVAVKVAVKVAESHTLT